MSKVDKSQQKSTKSFKIDISNYKIIKKLRSGAFASIYSVKDNRTSNIYAAKISKYPGDDDEQNKKMINREIRILMLFQHPTIIKFYGYSLVDFSGSPRVTILMDLAKNGSLYDVLSKSRDGFAKENYNNTARQIILTGIARGMMFLHQHNVIHRDLKAANILLDENFHPHITDFGLSKIFESGQELFQSQSVGTSYYMAPEVIIGNRYNGKADVYSFGIIMYEVLTDSIPYPLLENGKMSVISFQNKVAYQDYRPKFTVSIKKSLRKLIERCWSKDPNERPTFEEIFNKLAFNIESSIYNVFDDSFEEDDKNEEEGHENKYYLDDLEIDDFLCYIDEIVESDIKEDLSSSKATINNLKNERESMIDEVNGIPHQIEQISKRLTQMQQKFDDTFQQQSEINAKTIKSLKVCEKDIKSLKKRI